MGYMYVYEHYGGGQHIDTNWSPIFEDLYKTKLDFRILAWLMCFLCCFSFISFSDTPIPFTMHFRSP